MSRITGMGCMLDGIIGMAGTSRSIETIGEKLAAYAHCPIVVDPVMVSTSGHSF